jgi:hypothetical protein
LVLSITLIGSCRIIVPKLRMVWSGQEVLVSQLVQDQKQTLRKRKTTMSRGMYNVTGLQDSSMPPYSRTGVSSPPISAPPPGRPTNVTSGELLDDSKNEEYNGKETEHTPDIDEEDMEAAKRGCTFNDEETPKSLQPSFKSATIPVSADHASDKSRKIVIREHAVPSKQLILRMIDLQGELDMINRRIMSGLSVEKEEWETVRRLTSKLEHTFENVEFEWEGGSK